MSRDQGARTKAQIGAANRRAGRELEREVQLELERSGWYVLKTGGGQASIVDVLAIEPLPPGYPVWFIQCKVRGYVPPAERAELARVAETYGARPVVAYWHKDGRAARVVRFRYLEGGEVFP